MGKIDYRGIYEKNQDEWKALTREPQKYEALLAGHYSESNHFVYELLQNAEDENADRVVIEYYDDKLIFYHNGDAFDEEDVIGVSSMLKGTKDKSSAQTIGRFGMGFKSVFKYTYQPEIYSDEEAFCIENYLLPVEIECEWNFREAKENLSYRLSSGGQYRPFMSQEHLTKIVIPFYKRQDDGNLKKVSGEEVLQKLEQLTGEILLFLNHIKRLFWINKRNNKYGMISLDEDQTDKNLLTCRIGSYGNKEETTRYLKFKKVFDHENMTSAEVSVAYKVNNRANNVNELTGPVPVWVYFPTRDMTKLPFYIHGSFETAVSREKLMTPSQFNADMFEQLGNLIQESLLELKKRNLITQVFIRRVLLAAFRDEAENNTIPGLRKKITQMFLSNALLPDRMGEYRKTTELSVPVPFGISDFADSSLLAETLSNVNAFVAFNNEKEANFNEYFGWLTEELQVNVFSLANWARKLKVVEFPVIDEQSIKFAEVQRFYDFLSDNQESLYTTGLAYSRSGRYELKIRQVIANAWEELRQAPIILNATGAFVPAYREEEQVLYLNGKNDYQTLMKSAIVYHKIADSFTQLLKDGFKLSDFDNFQYVKEKVVKKYINGENINFESDDHTSEYVEDLNQIFALFENNQNVSGLVELLSRASIIKIKPENDSNVYVVPSRGYVNKSIEGVNLAVYYERPKKKHLTDEDEDYNYDYLKRYLIDEEFYAEQGISLKKLQQFGLITTPVTDGKRSDSGGPGQEAWRALGEYCPRINVDFLDENLQFIENHRNMDLAKKKSAEILKLLIAINEKLSGIMRRRKSNPYDVQDECYILKKVKKYKKWLYDKNGSLHSTSSISKFELDENIYGPIQKDKDIYVRLGFKETEEDSTAEAFEQVDQLDERNKRLLLKQLARELGMRVSDKDADDEVDTFTSEEDGDDVFDGETWISDAFPVSRVRNMESLVEHVKQQFFCADPVRYEKVLRQIRTSKSPRIVRAYVGSMYMNDSNVKICQMCKRPIQQMEAIEIANFGIELPQLNLCLCRECSGIYKSMRDVNKDAFKEGIKQAILGLNLEEKSHEYEIEFNEDTSLYFTETHVAEIQTIFGLLSEFGTPGADEEKLIDVIEPEDVDSKPEERFKNRQEDALIYREQDTQQIFLPEMEQSSQMEFTIDFTPNMQPIKDGALVSYKKMNTLEIVDSVMDSTKYPLHKSFIGKRIGDVVVANGKRFLIVSIL